MIEQADQPQSGETPEPLASEDRAGVPPRPAREDLAETPGGGISGRPFAGLERSGGRGRAGAPAETPEEQPAVEEDSGDDWRTWSGRSVNP